MRSVGYRALITGVEDKPDAPFLPSKRCVFRGPPSVLPEAQCSPLPPRPQILHPLRIGPRPAGGRGPRALTSPAEGGREARGGGGDAPRLSTSESSLPGLVLLRNRRLGREPGGRATGAAARGWPWRGRGAPAGRGPSRDLLGGGRGAGWAADGGSSGHTSGWKRALSRPPWLWGCPPRKHLPGMWPWSVGT